MSVKQADYEREWVDAPLPQEPPEDTAPDSRNRAGTESNGAEVEKSLLSGMITAAKLDRMEFPPLVEHVPHLIPEGFGILAGSPKAGKSWLAADIALACAQGGTALAGIPVEPRDVLLLALEDGPRRLQDRMRRLNHDQPLPARLDILTAVEPGMVTATIAEWLNRHAHEESPPLVILDTLGKARPQRRAGEDPYIADYQFGTRLKNIIGAVPGAALLAVHHTRKAAAEDWLDTVSGTQGIAGSADYLLVLKRKRKSDEGVLAVTGRDIVENEYALRTDQGIWSLDGMDIHDAAATVAARAEAAQQSRLGDRSLDAMLFVDSRPTTTPAELAKHLSIDSRVAGNLLARLATGGYIAKRSRGTYAPITDESDESDEIPGQRPPAVSPLSSDSSPDAYTSASELAEDDSPAAFFGPLSDHQGAGSSSRRVNP